MALNKLDDLYNKLLKELKDIKTLGVIIVPNGSYATGYNRDRLPPYQVGLIGALSLLYGDSARSSLGISFDESMALERGFNGDRSKDIKYIIKGRKRKENPIYKFHQIGHKLIQEIYYTGLEHTYKTAKKIKLGNLFDQILAAQQPLPGNGIVIPEDVPPPMVHIDFAPAPVIDAFNAPAQAVIPAQWGGFNPDGEDGVIFHDYEEALDHWENVVEQQINMIPLEIVQQENINNNNAGGEG